MGKERVLAADSELCGVAEGDTSGSLRQGTMKGQQLPRISRSCLWVRGGHHRSKPEGQGWSGGDCVTGQQGSDLTEILATKFRRFPSARCPRCQMGQEGFGSGTGLAAWELPMVSRGALRGG